MTFCSKSVLDIFCLFFILLSDIGRVSSRSSTSPCLGSCETGVDGITKVCRFDFKVNLFASELGYFQVDQCGDVPNPTLGIEKGVTYIFSQKVCVFLTSSPVASWSCSNAMMMRCCVFSVTSIRKWIICFCPRGC